MQPKGNVLKLFCSPPIIISNIDLVVTNSCLFGGDAVDAIMHNISDIACFGFSFSFWLSLPIVLLGFDEFGLLPVYVLQ